MTQSHHRPRTHMEDPLKVVVRAVNKANSLWLKCTYPFASIGRKPSIHYTCQLSRRRANQIHLGDSVILNKDVWLNVVSEDVHEVKIFIGDNCAIGRRNTITAKNCIHIERNVISGPGVLIQDHAHAFEDVRLPIREQGVTAGGRIRIEEGCWIGQGAAIICNKGELLIGRNSVIGANAVVTKSFPPNSVIVGIPGRLATRFDLAKGTWVRSERSGACE